MLSAGGSVANARAPIVSMIKLTHSSWTAVRTEVSVPLATAGTKVNITAVILIVIWNYQNLVSADSVLEPIKASRPAR
jgi:hypothetical protein